MKTGKLRSFAACNPNPRSTSVSTAALDLYNCNHRGVSAQSPLAQRSWKTPNHASAREPAILRYHPELVLSVPLDHLVPKGDIHPSATP